MEPSESMLWENEIILLSHMVFIALTKGFSKILSHVRNCFKTPTTNSKQNQHKLTHASNIIFNMKTLKNWNGKSGK